MHSVEILEIYSDFFGKNSWNQLIQYSTITLFIIARNVNFSNEREYLFFHTVEMKYGMLRQNDIFFVKSIVEVVVTLFQNFVTKFISKLTINLFFFSWKNFFEGYCFLWWVKLLLSLILVPASLLCPMTHESMKCTVWKNQKFTLTWFFSWNQFISDLLVTNVDLMEFFQNFVRVKSCNFHTVKY